MAMVDHGADSFLGIDYQQMTHYKQYINIDNLEFLEILKPIVHSMYE
jgi:hypothetical protein